MKRVIDGALAVAVLVGAVWTYQIKHEAEVLSKKRAELKAEISAQERKILLLRADWALETSPKRLEILAKRYSEQLGLQPLQATQIVTTDELPALRLDREDSERRAAASNGVGDGPMGIDPRGTGGISDLIDRELSQ